DLPKAQFLWTFEGYEPEASTIAHVVERESLSARFEAWDSAWRVSGWLGTARKPKDLDDDEAGNLNGIVVFARGRLFHENVLDRLNDGRLYTKYLTGQIEADFLDADDQPDIATSDRQRVQEDDERYIQLIAFLGSQLNKLEKRWNEWRRKHEVEKAKENSPALAEWLKTLPDGYRKSAETLIAKLSALPVDDEDDRKLMYRHGILAFERMKLRGSTDEFVTSVESADRLLAVLADRDSLEASLYRDIVKSRLDAIRDFQTIIDEDAKERVLQKYLFDHLWLLDPAWERATGSQIMESRLTTEGVLVEDLTEKERLGRVDIAYRTQAGKHVIVELKKVGRKMGLLELVEQGQTYVDKLKKILREQNVTTPDIEVVFVLGKAVDEESTNPERLKASMASIAPGSRIVHYDTLIRGAQEG
ncbi:MAG: ATP-binding protein, partial [bacterium]